MWEVINQAISESFIPTILFWAGMIIVALLIFPPTRPLLGTLMTQVFTPTGRGILAFCFQWMIWAIKTLIHSHQEVIKHLTTPRSKLYPTLKENQPRGKEPPRRD